MIGCATEGSSIPHQSTTGFRRRFELYHASLPLANCGINSKIELKIVLRFQETQLKDTDIIVCYALNTEISDRNSKK